MRKNSSIRNLLFLLLGFSGTFLKSEFSLGQRTSRPFAYHAGVWFTKGWWFWKEKSYCSGSIIAQNWIITLASCYIEGSYITVFVGNDFFFSGIQMHCRLFIRHENYTRLNPNNIALIKTEKMKLSGNTKNLLHNNVHNLFFEDAVNAISLPGEKYWYFNLNGQRCIFSGWGEGKEFYKGLAIAEVTVREARRCHEHNSVTIWAEFAFGANDVINGGSPLVYDLPDGRRMLVGMYRGSQGKLARFIAFTDPSYIKWIKNKTGLAFD